MANVIVMPRLSPTMEEGVLAKWTRKEGDKISPGDIIAEVETDKANMDFPLEDEGVLLKQLAKAGDTIKLGAPVGILGEEGEDISALLAEVQGGQAAPKAEEGPAEDDEEEAKPDAKAEGKPEAKAEGKPEKTEGKPDKAEGKPEGKAEGKTEAKPTVAEAAESGASDAAPSGEGKGRILTSPLARRLADEAGIDIRKISGSGPGGRVVKRDIERAAAEAQAKPAKAAAPQPAQTATQAKPAQATGAATATAAPAAMHPQDEEISLPMIRRIAAKRLVEAKQVVPHIYLTSDAAVDALWQFREQVNQTVVATGGEKVSFNDLVLKALARALRVVPAANTSFGTDGQHAIRHNRVDISVAVALEDGLITPVVRDADKKSIGALSKEIRELAHRAREKKLRPEEYTGGTFSLTNLGMYGVREFCAIINPPESGILAVGRIEKRAIVVEKDGHDELTIGRRMTLTMSCDHRILDGVLGAQLLAEVVRGLEQPLLLVL